MALLRLLSHLFDLAPLLSSAEFWVFSVALSTFSVSFFSESRDVCLISTGAVSAPHVVELGRREGDGSNKLRWNSRGHRSVFAFVG